MQKKSFLTFQGVEQHARSLIQFPLRFTAAIRALISCLILLICIAHPNTFSLRSFYGFFLTEGIFFAARISAKRFCAFIRGYLVYELFYVFVQTYLFPGLLFLEIIYIPLILLDITFLFSLRAALVLELFIGCFFAPFMSYGFYSNTSIFFLEYSLPFWAAVWPIYFLFTSLSGLCAILIDAQKKMSVIHQQEVKINRNLDSMNRVISGQMFSIKAESDNSVRMQITKDIHDSVGYIFTNLTMMLQASEALYSLDPLKVGPMLSKCVEYSCQGINDIRNMLREMRLAQKNSSLSLQRDLAELGCLFSRCTGTVVALEYGNWPHSFSPQLDSFFLSFLKESLTNAVKHGMATTVRVTCWYDGRVASMSIEDNGVGLQGALTLGIGLQSMREILAKLGGHMEISPGAGFTLRVEIPFSLYTNTRNV